MNAQQCGQSARESNQRRWDEVHAALYRTGYVGEYSLLSSDALTTAFDAYDRGMRGTEIDTFLRPEVYN